MSELRTNQPIDPQIEAMLDKLRVNPERDPQAVAANRAKFETQLDAYLESSYASPEQVSSTWRNPYQKIKENYQMMKNNYRFAYMFTVVLFVLAVVLFSGAGATVSAAQGALPGDSLYPVKTGLEQAQVRLASDEYKQAQLYLEFAELRLGEAAVLIEEGRFDDVSTAVTEFDFYVQKATKSLEALSSQDPGRAAQLSSQISDALSRYALVLTGMLDQVPETVGSDVARSIEMSESVFSEDEGDEIEIIGVVEAIMDDAWVIDGQVIKLTAMTEIEGDPVVGDQVKVHANVDDDGSLIAREIAPAVGDDGNLNENGAADVNDNGADDVNDNGDDNVNDNGDGDINDNDDADVNNNGDDDANNNGDGDINDNDDADVNNNDDADVNNNDDADVNNNDDADVNNNDDADVNNNDDADVNNNDDADVNNNGDDDVNNNGDDDVNNNGDDDGNSNGDDDGNNNGGDDGNNNGGDDGGGDDGGGDDGGGDDGGGDDGGGDDGGGDDGGGYDGGGDDGGGDDGGGNDGDNNGNNNGDDND